MGRIVKDSPCPQCRANGGDKTGNHLIHFEDGGVYCNRCGYKGESKEVSHETKGALPQSVPETIYSGRGISADIASVYDLRFDPVTGAIWIPKTKGGTVVGWKLKTGGDYHVLGDGKNSDLFGQHLLHGGNKVFITEGELDACSVAQALVSGSSDEQLRAFGFPSVVSVPDGCKSAVRVFTENKNILGRYNEIVIVPDQDEAGKELVEAAVEIFGYEKVKEAKLSRKDANDMLQAGLQEQLRMQVLGAKQPVPEAVIFGDDITIEVMTKPIAPGLIIPQYPGMMRKLRGLRCGEGAGELTVICSGSGMGKTTYTHEWAYALRKYHDIPIGQIRLEERVIKSAQAMIALDNNIPLPYLRSNPDVLSPDKWEKSRTDLLCNRRVAFLDHFGSLDSRRLVDHFKYLAYAVGCRVIFLDHISMVVSGQESSRGGERKDIDLMMTNLASFVEQSGCSVVAVVHLKRPEGDNSYNEGYEIGLSSLRGSAGLEQLSHNVISIQGDQRDESKKNLRETFLLKSREWGDVGRAETVVYIPGTGRFLSTEYIANESA